MGSDCIISRSLLILLLFILHTATFYVFPRKSVKFKFYLTGKSIHVLFTLIWILTCPEESWFSFPPVHYRIKDCTACKDIKIVYAPFNCTYLNFRKASLIFGSVSKTIRKSCTPCNVISRDNSGHVLRIVSIWLSVKYSTTSLSPSLPSPDALLPSQPMFLFNDHASGWCVVCFTNVMPRRFYGTL